MTSTHFASLNLLKFIGGQWFDFTHLDDTFTNIQAQKHCMKRNSLPPIHVLGISIEDLSQTS